MNIFTLIKLIPTIIRAVHAVEEIFPVSGAGKTKLELILGLITDAAGDISKYLPTITAWIKRIVDAANVLGVFRKAA